MTRDTVIAGVVFSEREYPDPFLVECPLCAAGPGHPCIAFSRFGPVHLAKATHSARMKKARQEAP